MGLDVGSVVNVVIAVVFPRIKKSLKDICGV
jgi:hypothetical protein